MTRENEEVEKAKLLAKPVEQLTVDNALLFNGCKIVKGPIGEGISLIQKEQGQRLELVDFSSPTYKQAYLEHRARGAYIATICQPEASCDLSRAAQSPQEKMRSKP